MSIRVLLLLSVIAMAARATTPPLIYSHLIMGQGQTAIATDSLDNVYLVGQANGSNAKNIPTTPGAYSTAGGMFLMKLDPSGNTIYSTFIGPAAPTGIAVDSSGCAYITGTITSTTYPTTAGALKTTAPKGSPTGFVTKVNATGTGLIYSTFLGGSTSDTPNGIAVDSANNAVVVGNTTSADFPTTAGALRTTIASSTDAFLAKLNAQGTGLVFSTFFGGLVQNEANGVALDPTGNIYVTGDAATLGANFPVTPGAFNNSDSRSQDVFVAKFTPAGALVYSSLFGDTGTNSGASIAVDSSGSAYVTGRTQVTGGVFPIVGGLGNSGTPGSSSAFVTKLSPDAHSLIYSTFLDSNQGAAIRVDALGDAYVLGCYQYLGAACSGALSLSMLHPAGSSLIYSVSQSGFGASIAVDSTQSAYFSNFALVAKYGPVVTPSLTVASNIPVTVQVSGGSCLPNSYFMQPASPLTLNVPPGTACTFTLPNRASVSANSAQAFVGWTDGSSANPRTITVTGTPASFGVTYAPIYLLSTAVSSPGSGSLVVAPASSDNFYPGAASVQLTATPASGFAFAGWSGDLTGNTNPTTLNMSAPRTVTANFYSTTGCTFTLPFASAWIAVSGGTASVNVTASSTACQWGAFTNSPFITIVSAAGSGSGVLTYSASPYTGNGSRSGVIYIGGQALTINQGAGGPPKLADLQPGFLSGARNTLTLRVFDSNSSGIFDLSTVYLLIQDALYSRSGCYIEYNSGTAQYRLLADDGVNWLATAPSLSSALSNGSCTVYGISPAVSGNTLSLTFDIGLSAGFNGPKTVFANAYTLARATSGWGALGGWWPDNPTPGALVLQYRIYDPYSHSHLYTTDANEYAVLGTRGFIQEGAPNYVLGSPGTSGGVAGVPLYRVYGAASRVHYWTVDRADFFNLLANSNNIAEGVSGFLLPSQPAGFVPWYRLLFCCSSDPSLPIYHWTSDQHEYDVLRQGPFWSGQGAIGYVQLAGSAQNHAVAPNPLTVLSDASYAQPPLAPGQRVHIFGADVARSTILVNGSAAETIGISRDEVVAVLPHGAVETWRIEAPGVGAANITAALSSPAIYTSDGSGSGPADAAFDGDLVTFTITGASDENLPLEVTIGGYRSDLVSITRLEEGKTAVTSRIPRDLAPGVATLTVRIGETWSQSGVTLRLP